MTSLLIVGCSFIILIVLVLFSKITVTLVYQQQEFNNHLTLQFSLLFGMIRLKKEIPSLSLDRDLKSVEIKDNQGERKEWTIDDTKESMEKMQDFVREMENTFRFIKLFLTNVHIKKWEWVTSFGVRDAYYTALLSGSLWAIKGGIEAFLYQFCQVKKQPILEVRPQFSASTFSLYFEGIISVQIGHAIKVAYRFKKRNVRRIRKHVKSSY